MASHSKQLIVYRPVSRESQAALSKAQQLLFETIPTYRPNRSALRATLLSLSSKDSREVSAYPSIPVNLPSSAEKQLELTAAGLAVSRTAETSRFLGRGLARYIFKLDEDDPTWLAESAKLKDRASKRLDNFILARQPYVLLGTADEAYSFEDSLESAADLLPPTVLLDPMAVVPDSIKPKTAVHWVVKGQTGESAESEPAPVLQYVPNSIPAQFLGAMRRSFEASVQNPS